MPDKIIIKDVKRKSGRVGSATHYKKELRKKEYLQMCSEGLSYLEIITKLNVSVRVLTYYAIETGVAPAIGMIDDEEVSEHLEEYDDFKERQKNDRKAWENKKEDKNNDKYDEDWWM